MRLILALLIGLTVSPLATAMAQTPKITLPKLGPNAPDPIQQFNDKIKADFSKATGVKATGDLPFDILKMLDAKLLPDLQYSLKLAQANGNTLTANCWTAWIGIIQTNEKAVADANGNPTDPPDPHIITDLERAIDIRNELQPSSPFMVACSPLANLVKTDVTNFIGQILAGGVGLAKLVPGL